MPEWDAGQMRQHLPALMGWVMYGALLGVIHNVSSDLAEWLLGPEPGDEVATVSVTKRIVILGGGFAGMRVAECLEERLGTDFSVGVTVVNTTNTLLFTPLLAEVAGGSLEPSHISTSLRSALRRTEIMCGRVTSADVTRRLVIVESGTEGEPTRREVPYDYLVFALGSVSNYFGMANVKKLAFDFKRLFDAVRIRNHVIEMFERADLEPDPLVRSRLLTFVIAGGGFAGVEIAGALNDFARGILPDYPNVQPSELSIVLVHSRERILPELSESLAQYAQDKMTRRGVEFRLTAKIVDALPGAVALIHGEIPSETLIWTAGTAPNPLLNTLPFENDNRGALIVDAFLAVPGHARLWAVGDCASVTDFRTGRRCPPTAQFALRQAEVVAANIFAEIRGLDGLRFQANSRGALCVVGHQVACAELVVPLLPRKSMRFSGFFAWLLWRAIYLAKLPGLERKLRVLMDWTVEVFFPRDIVQTLDLE
jgi:NADH:ubiquinone reductase (H+-translocating)